MARAGTAVKGVSCYGPNIDMFRRRALWSMQRRRARDAQKWFAASQLPRHLWLWLQRALSGRAGALCKSKPGECVPVQHLHKDVVLQNIPVWCLDDALTSVAKFLRCPVISFLRKTENPRKSIRVPQTYYFCMCRWNSLPRIVISPIYYSQLCWWRIGWHFLICITLLECHGGKEFFPVPTSCSGSLWGPCARTSKTTEKKP